MRTLFFKLATIGLGVFALAAGASAQSQITQLGVGEITAANNLVAKAARTNQTGSVDHLVESLNEHLLVQFEQSNKFKVIAKSDLGAILNNQEVPVNLAQVAEDAKPLPEKITGLDYLVLTKVTDFADIKEGVVIEGAGQRADKRTVQSTVVMKIYNAATGELVKAISLPVRQSSGGVRRMARNEVGNEAEDDTMIEQLAIEIASRSATRVVDVIFPARIVSVSGVQVTINRGEGSGVMRSQVWEVFKPGPALIDPDTGKSLGFEEIKVGELEVTDVQPTYSKCLIRGNNTGIEAKAIARLRYDEVLAPR